MRVSAGRVLAGNPETRVAVHAEELTVADDALTRVGCGLLIVDGDEVGPVHRVTHWLVEPESRRNRRHGDPVAGRALALRVALRAQITLRIGLYPVLPQEVAVMNHVAFRQCHLAG
jgi:hypothetical protein